MGAAGQARGLEVGTQPLVARVVPDVRTLSKTFDYLVPEAFRDQVLSLIHI